MALWRILAYHLPENDSCPMQDWYAVQDEEVQAAFDAAMTTLKARVDWTDTWQFKVLTKKHGGLGEVRFKLNGPPIRRFRPVGIWPPLVEREFVLLLGCEKQRQVYIPDDAFTLALEYKRQLEQGRGRIDEYV
jgi:hypothetical protein